MSENENLTIYKIVMIGSVSVGKTSIRLRYCGLGFSNQYLTTLGADFSIKKIESSGNSNVLQIWDLAGQTSYNNLRSNYYKGIQGAIVVFDLSNENTLQSIDKWLDEMLKYSELENIPTTIIVGNKADLVSLSYKDELQLNIDAKIIELNEKYNLKLIYVETSALTGQNIDFVFTQLFNRITEELTNNSAE